MFFTVMVLLPAIRDSRWLAVATTFVIFTIVALSQDIVLGKAGMFYMGQALFFGLGASTTAVLNSVLGLPLLATLPLAIIIPAVFGVLLAGPIIHLRGDSLLVSTIVFNIVFVQALQNNLGGVTGGPNGIFGLEMLGIPGLMAYQQFTPYYAALTALVLTLCVLKNLESSKIGRTLHYLREDDLASRECREQLPHIQDFFFCPWGRNGQYGRDPLCKSIRSGKP